MSYYMLMQLSVTCEKACRLSTFIRQIYVEYTHKDMYDTKKSGSRWSLGLAYVKLLELGTTLHVLGNGMRPFYVHLGPITSGNVHWRVQTSVKDETAGPSGSRPKTEIRRNLSNPSQFGSR